MFNRILVRYGEIGIKGRNRFFFEKKLVSNIKDCLKKNNLKYEKVNRFRGRIVIFLEDAEKAIDYIKNVFGIVTISFATETTTDIEKIKEAAYELGKNANLNEKKTFRISAKRLNKQFGMNSQQINEIVGDYIQKKTNAKVELKTPTVPICIELIEDKAFLFNDKIKCFGGLPVGCEGKVAVLLNEEKSLAAAFLMLKRGCNIVLVENKKIDYKNLEKFCYGSRLEVTENIPEDAKAVISSETLNELKLTKFINNKVILRPLIGYNKEEIEKILKIIKP